jgi:hypothetical protein
MEFVALMLVLHWRKIALVLAITFVIVRLRDTLGL